MKALLKFKQGLPVRLVALLNDTTTGTMITSAYDDPETITGNIFDTGCNAAYLEDCQYKPVVLVGKIFWLALEQLLRVAIRAVPKEKSSATDTLWRSELLC